MKNLVVVLTLAGFAASAEAATTSTTSFGLQLVETLTELNATGTLHQFDPSLGALTGASLTLYSAATFSFTGENTSTQSQTARLTPSISVSWSSSLVGLNGIVDGVFQNLLATSGSQSYAPGQTRSFGGATASTSDIRDLSSILAALTGTGSVAISCMSLTGMTVQGGGGFIATTQSTTAACGAEITYTYTPVLSSVPEPFSLGLFGAGLMGLGIVRRRR